MSTVIGTVMMVAVTVVVFSGVALIVFDQVDQAPDSRTAELDIAGRGDQSLVLTHEGGEPLRLADAELQMTVDGNDTTVPLTDLASQTADGTRWVIGESLCLIGTSSQCLHPPGTSITKVLVVHGNSIILSYDGGA